VEGMKVLVERLFGISMVEAPLTQKERWDLPDDANDSAGDGDGKIRKFHFTHPEEGPLGTVYLDLHPREGKYGHAAHFTVRCGCALRSSPSDEPFSDSSSNSSSFSSRGAQEYQLPIVALVCNLSPAEGSPDGHNAGLLSHSEVETLLHEFGHALHSLLGRTHFQHLAGTRAAMDFIEVPSHVMENYAWDPAFLKLIGRHYRSGEELDDATIARVVRGRFAFKSLEATNQVLYSEFDQALFGPPPANGGDRLDTTKLFAELHKSHHVPYAEGTHWHTKFGHLVTYGAGYYGYLYSQVFAADVWSTVLAPSSSQDEEAGGRRSSSSSMGRSGGMKLWNEVLRHGGARDPNVMLKNVLGRETTSPGMTGFSDELRWR